MCVADYACCGNKCVSGNCEPVMRDECILSVQHGSLSVSSFLYLVAAVVAVIVACFRESFKPLLL